MENLLTATLYTAVDTLERHRYQYALAGGLAFGMLVEPRATVDIDICCLLAEEDYPVLFSRLREVLPGLLVHPQPMRFARVNIHRAVYFSGPCEVIIDFVAPHDRVFVESAMQRRVMLEMAGRKLYVVTPEDLIVLKTWAGRPQDELDITNIRSKYVDALDAGYLRRWGIAW